MPYTLNVSEQDVLGENKYINEDGETQCVTFVRAITDAPHTTKWKQGLRVADTKSGSIRRGTAIATFDKNGHYPVKGNRHAAIYLSHSPAGIQVLDQWTSQGEVLERTIYFNKPAGTRLSNIAEEFYVIN
jgi:hypothetical protein